MAKPKPITVEDRNGVDITVSLVEGNTPGLAVFIPGDFSKPDALDESAGGRVKMLVSTENWLSFKGILKGWDLIGGIHFGYSKPRKSRKPQSS